MFGFFGKCYIRNKLKEAAENIGLPTFVVADAGRTQVSFSRNNVKSDDTSVKYINSILRTCRRELALEQ